MTVFAELASANDQLLRDVDEHVASVTSAIENHAPASDRDALLSELESYKTMVRSELCSIGRIAEGLETDATRARQVAS